MKFSLIHPSRSRPDKSFATISKWSERFVSGYGPFELIVSVDADDNKLKEYKEKYSERHLIINDNKSTVSAINNAAKIASGDIFIVVSDDSDCPNEWNEILMDAIGESKDFVMKTDDGIQKRIITMTIMDRLYFERDGYIYNPIYDHSWADTELTEVAHLRRRVITRMDIKFLHLHPEVTKEPKDDLYKRNDLTHDRDRHIYQKRKSLNFGL